MLEHIWRMKPAPWGWSVIIHHIHPADNTTISVGLPGDLDKWLKRLCETTEVKTINTKEDDQQ